MPPSKILFIFCLSFIGWVFIFSFFGPQWLKIQSPNGRGQTPSKVQVGVLGDIKERFRIVINSNLPNPQCAILAGILLGDRVSFSPEWKQKLAKTGTSHIVAVSGMNIALLAQILVIVGLSLGLFRQQALFLSLVLIWLFIGLTGFQASAVRAGVMGSVLIVCQILGRQGATLRALTLAVAIMLFLNPELLRYSLSFQLSVLATLGLIELSPAIETKLKKIKIFANSELSQIISATLAASIFTTPLLIYTFGQISLIGAVVNVLIAPLLLPVMVLGIIFLLFGLINSALGVVLAWPVGILLGVIVWIIDIFAKLPFATVGL